MMTSSECITKAEKATHDAVYGTSGFARERGEKEAELYIKLANVLIAKEIADATVASLTITREAMERSLDD